MLHACRVCHEDFEPSASMARARNWICKACDAAKSHAYYEANPEKVKERVRAYHATPGGKAVKRKASARYSAKYPDREAARNAVSHAIAAGKLVPQPCQNCPSTKQAHGHHEDYSKPLDVIWLCKTCHDELHAHKRNLKQREVELAALAW